MAEAQNGGQAVVEVSVIIANHNGEKFIADAIRFLLECIQHGSVSNNRANPSRTMATYRKSFRRITLKSWRSFTP